MSCVTTNVLVFVINVNECSNVMLQMTKISACSDCSMAVVICFDSCLGVIGLNRIHVLYIIKAPVDEQRI